MTSGEIVSILAVAIAFCGMIISFVYSARKDGRESGKDRAAATATLSTIQNELRNIGANVERIERKVDKIDDRSEADHEKIIENDTKIKNLEKEVFKRERSG